MKKKIIESPKIYKVELDKSKTLYTDIEILDYALNKVGFPPMSMGLNIGAEIKDESRIQKILELMYVVFKAGILIDKITPELFILKEYKSLDDFVNTVEKRQSDEIKESFL